MGELEAGEMALLVERLACKLEDLTSIPITHGKSWARWHAPVIPVSVRKTDDRRIPGAQRCTHIHTCVHMLTTHENKEGRGDEKKRLVFPVFLLPFLISSTLYTLLTSPCFLVSSFLLSSKEMSYGRHPQWQFLVLYRNQSRGIHMALIRNLQMKCSQLWVLKGAELNLVISRDHFSWRTWAFYPKAGAILETCPTFIVIIH